MQLIHTLLAYGNSMNFLESARDQKTNPSDDEEWDPSVGLDLRSRG